MRTADKKTCGKAAGGEPTSFLVVKLQVVNQQVFLSAVLSSPSHILNFFLVASVHLKDRPEKAFSFRKKQKYF